MTSRNKRSGFTLIELMMVVIIIGILAAIALPKFTGSAQKARRNAAIAEIAMIGQTLDRYEMENGAYPSTEQGLKALIEKPSGSPAPQDWSGPYLTKDPVDPWAKPYQYRCPSQNNNPQGFDIWSSGPDTKDGTEDDIANWKK